MSEARNYTRRTTEERIKKLDSTISRHYANIKTLEEQKHRLLNPAPRGSNRIGLSTVLKKAKELGMTPKEMLEKLDISL